MVKEHVKDTAGAILHFSLVNKFHEVTKNKNALVCLKYIDFKLFGFYWSSKSLKVGPKNTIYLI